MEVKISKAVQMAHVFGKDRAYEQCFDRIESCRKSVENFKNGYFLAQKLASQEESKEPDMMLQSFYRAEGLDYL